MAIQRVKVLLIDCTEKILSANFYGIKEIISTYLGKQLKKDEKILDLGCGTGHMSSYFPESSYTGIDLDAPSIEAAQLKYKHTFRVMDASKLTFPDKSFDKILIYGVLHHLDNITFLKTSKEMKRVLTKNGLVLAIEAINPTNSFDLLGRFLRSRDQGKYIRTPQDYIYTLSKFFTVKKSFIHRSGLFQYVVIVLKKNL